MLNALMRAPLSYFEITPSGRYVDDIIYERHC